MRGAASVQQVLIHRIQFCSDDVISDKSFDLWMSNVESPTFCGYRGSMRAEFTVLK